MPKASSETLTRPRQLVRLWPEKAVQARSDAGLTPADVAELASMNQSTVSKIERGVPVMLDTATRYARALDKTVTQLEQAPASQATDRGEPHPAHPPAPGKVPAHLVAGFVQVVLAAQDYHRSDEGPDAEREATEEALRATAQALMHVAGRLGQGSDLSRALAEVL